MVGGGRGRGIRYGSKGKRITLVRFYLLSRGWKHRSCLCVFVTFALKTFDVENFNHTQNKWNNNKLIFIHYTTSAIINILPCLFHLHRPLLPPNLTVILTHTSVRYWTFLSLQETPRGLFPVEHHHCPQPKNWTIVPCFFPWRSASLVLELNVNGLRHTASSISRASVRAIHTTLHDSFLFMTE